MKTLSASDRNLVTRICVIAAVSLILALSGKAFAGDTNDVKFVEQTNALPAWVPGAILGWADINNDARLDVLIATTTNNPFTTDLTRIFLNTEAGFVDSGISLAGYHSGNADWGDFDNDGFVDLAIGGLSYPAPVGTRIYRNVGGTNFVLFAFIPNTQAAVKWGDFNGDGFLDLAVCGYYYGGGDASYFHVFTNYHGMGFSQALDLSRTYWGTSVDWADYDHDGNMDLILVDPQSRGASLLRNDGTNFTLAGQFPALGPYAGGIWVDGDNDGWPDLFIGDWGHQTSYLYHNNRDGTFQSVATFSVGDVAAGDCDNDGFTDFFITSSLAHPPTLFLSSGADQWVKMPNFFPDTITPTWVDYDRDGRLDLAVPGHLYRNVSARTNTPPSRPSRLAATSAGTKMILSWKEATDPDQASGLTYNVRVGTAPGAGDAVSPMSAADGFRRIVKCGNADGRTNFVLRGLEPGRRYYWSVQAVDNGFAGGPFAHERSFVYRPTRDHQPKPGIGQSASASASEETSQ
jgi:FG-GAP-like repeat